ncbi:MAG: pyridoxal-phosphate dependent enzyme [Marmoricola sp.]
MTVSVAFDDITHARMYPDLVRLSDNLVGAVFSLMKLIPARHILRTALRRGELEPGTTIVETTSGTFGLALAMESAILDRKLVVVSDPVLGPGLRRRLENLGATVDIVSTPSPTGGFQQPRLDRVAQLRRESGPTFCPEQYSNPTNPDSYAPVARWIAEQLGDVDCVVGPVGSGGSMCGTVRALRADGRCATAVGVDTHRSTLFGQPDGHRQLRGLGNSLIPPNLDHTVFDQVHWCPPEVAYDVTRRAHREHALYQGPTSGAALAAASWWAGEHPDRTCVVLLPDDGYRYDETVYDDEWLDAQGMWPLAAQTNPREVDLPVDAVEGWCWMRWGRRSLGEVLAAADGRHPAKGVPHADHGSPSEDQTSRLR